MKSALLRSCGLRCVAALGAAMVLGTSAAHASLVIEFTGINLVYDGSALYDAGSAAGGFANPADADALASLDFFLNGSLVGSLNSDISLDFYIPGVTNIPTVTNSAFNLNTPGGSGFFDILIGTSPLASEFLIIDINSVSITYLDIAGQAQFLFGATISSTYAQNLPFDLELVGPLTISFSAQIDPGSLSTDGEFITGFTAFGTGEVAGAIPAPGALALLAFGGLLSPRKRRRA